MDAELPLQRKWSFRAHGERLVLVKRRFEKAEHVWMKALLWALFRPQYPHLRVEVSVRERYRPDLVAREENGEIVFWAEAGQVRTKKIIEVALRHRGAHLVIAKWARPAHTLKTDVERRLGGVRRKAPVEFLCFPADAASRFIATDGTLSIERNSVGLNWA
ncbi:MAG: hypothetical protein H7A21_14105 [Spirochaetales bacterium]|nr:hypothetical protein [Leptospiraceae bacterium]MCP5482566.1 hypothetical protein [Spirochaetales bacterium]MCP5485156.1 hypothetical protein [Spirochaetales bacterium]